GTTPEQIARTFLQENSDAFQLFGSTSSLITDDVQTVLGNSHVRFIQTYEGIPVFRGDVVVSINTNNEVSMAINNSKSAIQIASTTPLVSEENALEIARRHVGIRGRTTGKPDGSELMIYRSENGTDHLAHRVSMTNEDPMGDWQVFVDALTGEVLSVEDLFANERVQGSGYVYLSDPLSATRKMYNSPGFADNNDLDTDSLTAYRTQVTLDSLTVENAVYKLKGPYCNVTDVESPADPSFFSANSPNGFNYTRSQQEFEAVNVYYHVTTAYNQLSSSVFRFHHSLRFVSTRMVSWDRTTHISAHRETGLPGVKVVLMMRKTQT
ncbi:MAG: Por secretion system C-terminal sorting protein, partial [Bacteroidetes bacterium]|nr:Por secretion system C-terminal sorting protein [Bacteroidota bacterium]